MSYTFEDDSRLVGRPSKVGGSVINPLGLMQRSISISASVWLSSYFIVDGVVLVQIGLFFVTMQ
jgi:hypothetical protein